MEPLEIITSENPTCQGNSLPGNPKEEGHNDMKLVSSD